MKVNFITLLLVSLLASVLGAKSLPLKQSWMGGDAAYSILLKDKSKLIWFFGDTFISKPESPSEFYRSFGPDHFVFNTIGVSDPENFQDIHYYRKKELGEYGFFKPQGRDYPTKFWPKAPFYWQGELYLTLLEVKYADSLLGFLPFATQFIKIQNPGESPLYWTYEVVESIESSQVFPGTAFAEKDGIAYMLVTLSDADGGNQSIALARLVPADNIISLEYLNQQGRWEALSEKILSNRQSLFSQPSFQPQSLNQGFGGLAQFWDPIGEKFLANGSKLFTQASTEMSLHFHEDRQKWFVVYSSNPFIDPRVVIRWTEGSDIKGPWMEAKTIYSYPEMEEEIPGLLCYAGKAIYVKGDQLTFTYTCNSTNLDALLLRSEVYVPQIVKVEI